MPIFNTFIFIIFILKTTAEITALFVVGS